MAPTSGTDLASTTATVARWGLLGGASLFGVVYLVLVAYRLSYPFELEWMEGATVDHVRRVLEGQPLYGPPTLEFIPFIYPPLYYYVSALLTIPVGVGLLPLRLVSIVGSIGSALVIFSLVRRDTRHVEAAVLASALFLATFGASGYWFDLARVDSLFLCLALASVWMLRFATSRRGVLAAGLLLALAALVKQSALVMALPLIGGYAWYASRHRLLFVLAFGIPVAASVLLLDAASDGWFTYYVFDLPGQHPWTARQWVGFWTSDLIGMLPIAAALAAYGLYGRFADSARRSGWLLAFGVGFVGAAWLARLHEGGYVNTLMPAHAALAVLFGLGYSRLHDRWRARAVTGRPLARLGLYVVCMAQFGLLVYNPVRQVPSARDAEAGRLLVERIASVTGEVYVPFHGYVPTMAGKDTFAHEMAIRDIFKGRDDVISAALAAEIDDALRSARFAAIVLDGPSVFTGIDVSYDRADPIFGDEDVFWPVTGKQTRPTAFYLRRPAMADDEATGRVVRR